MKIKKVTVKGIKKIKFVEIEPGDESIIVLTGENSQGKTSFADAMFMCLGGKGSMGALPLNTETGAQEGTSLMELDNGLTIERIIRPTGTSLTVRDKDGKAKNAPQKYIDDTLRFFSFNPMEFADADPKEQAKHADQILATAVGKDVSRFQNQVEKYGITVNEEDNAIGTLDRLTLEVFDLRSAANRDVKTLSGAIGEGEIKDRSSEMRDQSEALARVTDNQKSLETGFANTQRVSEQFADMATALAKIQELIPENRIKTPLMQSVMASLTDKIPEAVAFIDKTMQTQSVAIKESREDIQEMGTKLAEIAASQSVFESHSALHDKLKKAKGDVAALEGDLTALRALKKDIISEIKMPVENMEVKNGVIYVDDKPFSELSQSEKLIISVRFAMALNPDLRVMRIMNGNVLDETTFNTLKKIVEENDFQLWIEWVGSDKAAGYLFVDGQIES